MDLDPTLIHSYQSTLTMMATNKIRYAHVIYARGLFWHTIRT